MHTYLQEIHVKVSMHSEKCRKEVMKAVTKLSGVNELSVDLEKEILMVIGDVDPVCVATCLRKKRRAAVIISVGPKKEDKDEDKDGDKNDDRIIPVTYFNAPHEYGYGYRYFPVYPPSRHGEGCFML
ncbi:putative heavy metal-associated domain, HMA, heavy metal-associated domain superfamily [Helianthus anomalus]